MTTIVEAIVGVFLILFGVAAVILFIILCELLMNTTVWGTLRLPHYKYTYTFTPQVWWLVWKLLLSRLGLFKELFSDLQGNKKEETRPRGKRPHHTHTTTTTHTATHARDSSTHRWRGHTDSPSTDIQSLGGSG